MKVKKTRVMNRNISLYLLSDVDINKPLDLEKEFTVLLPPDKKGMVVLNRKSMNLHMVLVENSITEELLYHELYHLYFYLLTSLNINPDYAELNKEIYANLFSTLALSIKNLKDTMV